jgi:PAS domain S-box-containing protein
MTRKTKYILAGLFAMLLVSLLLYGIDVQERKGFKEQLKSTVASQLDRLRGNLEAEINANFYLTRGLIAYVTFHPDLDQQTFEVFVKDLFKYQSSIRGIALAPGNVISFIYPMAGNEQALGLNYETNPDQWRAVKLAMDNRESVMAGPVNLVQGGSAFINRTPIYFNDPGTGEDIYWGLASVVLEQEELFANAGFNDPKLQIRFAVRGADGLGKSGLIFQGDEAVFEESPILLDVNFPGGSWQLAAVPINGWNASSPFLWWIRIGGLFFVIATGLGVFAWQKRQYDARLRLEGALQKVEEANNSLMESETFLSAVFENIPNMIFIKDAKDLRFVRFNKAGEDLLGIPREVLLGKSDYDFFPEDEARSFVQRDREVLKSLKLKDTPEESIHTQGKGERILHTQKIPLLDKAGSPQFLVGISEDITERKLAEAERERLEGQLRHSLKMESIGTLAGGIAHDFNNILAAILGYTEMALDDLSQDSPARQPIQQVAKAGVRARELVRHILSFSRRESREAIPVEIHLIVKEALKLLRATIPTTVKFDEDDISEVGYILADPTQIHQVVMNICTNASQAMADRGGVMEVSLSSVRLDLEDCVDQLDLHPGDYARLRVSDTGPGIISEDLDRIFDPYFTTKQVGKGSGMGLAVVLGIVRSHDGAIRVESTPGEGATFDVYFPIVKNPKHTISQDSEILPTGTENILVVDDEISLVEITKIRVEDLGYTATATVSSKQAVELFLSDPAAFDLVITDQTMPEMTGEEMARRILQVRPDMPIMLCTGYSVSMDSELAQKMGIKAYLMKPVSKLELATTIRRVLDESGSAS